MSETRRWLNQAQPQTLQYATWLLYIDAFFGVINALATRSSVRGLLLLLAGGQVAAGFGIANEKRWGYVLGIAMALSPFVLRFVFFGPAATFSTNLLQLLFEVALVALLLHPQSRDYQRVWFR